MALALIIHGGRLAECLVSGARRNLSYAAFRLDVRGDAIALGESDRASRSGPVLRADPANQRPEAGIAFNFPPGFAVLHAAARSGDYSSLLPPVFVSIRADSSLALVPPC